MSRLAKMKLDFSHLIVGRDLLRLDKLKFHPGKLGSCNHHLSSVFLYYKFHFFLKENALLRNKILRNSVHFVLKPTRNLFLLELSVVFLMPKFIWLIFPFASIRIRDLVLIFHLIVNSSSAYSFY